MALQFSTALRNARLDAIEVFAGVSAKIMIYSGSVPANPAASETGTLLAEFDMGSDWAAAASSGAKALNSLPLTTTAVAGAPTNATHFRMLESDGTTVLVQGTCTASGGGGDMILDNVSIATGQTVNITAFTITDGNA